MNTKVTKVISGILSVTLFSTTLTCFPVIAEDADKYPYTMFAGSSEEGAITINASNVCINGNIATNGTIVSSGNMNVNGSKTENAAEEMMFILEKLDSAYFSGSNVEFYTEDYSYEETNINISNPLEVEGDLELTGNINLITGIKALEDVNLNGDVKNTNESVICSETGDIIINTNNVNLNGLVYAPEGCVDITAQNLNMNNVIIIANTIKVECPNLNANYSTSMGEFVGTESEVDLELFAFGEYISESNSINVFWDTTIPKGTFDVQTSYDNETYTSVVTVTDVESYNYAISEEFEEMYIKVTETTYYGEICETVPFVVTKSEDGYTIDYLDSDEDGLPDIFETEIGTKIDISDSDEDGLTDYQEIYFTDTDPTIYSSVTEGIRDADIDSDSDGLSNIFELEYEIDPLLQDTDEDSLSDYDEIYVYITLPAVPDTDEDSIDDGSEIKLGLDPNNPETFGYPDAEYSIEQQIETDSPVMSEVNTEENAYGFSIEIKTNGYAEDVISVSESEYAAAIENEAMLGISTDIEIDSSCNAENIVLKYTIKDEYLDNTLGTYADCEELQGIKRLNVFKYFDELNMLLPIETQFDVDNNLIYTEVDDLGTYCVMDMEIWLDMLGVESVEEIEKEIALSEVQLEYDSPTVLSNETTYTYGDYIYTESNGVITIVDYTGSETNLVIPNMINDGAVTIIGNGAFSYNAAIESVTIPYNVMTIEESAFAGCKNLAEVTMSNETRVISEKAFAWCSSLENIILSDNITTIGESAFYGTGIEKLDLPNEVRSIDDYAFGSCTQLSSVNISENVIKLSDTAFYSCANLKEYNVDENNNYYLSVDGVLYNKNQTQLILYPVGKEGSSFTVPESVTLIGNRAFTGSNKLTNITLSSNVTYLTNCAFSLCTELTNIYVDEENISFVSVDGILFDKNKTTIIKYPQAKKNTNYTIPEGVTEITYQAFYWCENLVKINIPDSVTTIGTEAFYNCSNLTEMDIPDNVTNIGSFAFQSCEGLTSIIIPDGISSIERCTFYDCNNLTCITIPESVQSIAEDAFSGCNKLTIYGYTGSYAEEYANAKNINFVAIGTANTVSNSIIGVNWKRITLNGELNSTNGIDSDYDTLTDWQEINSDFLVWNEDGSFELPTLRDCIYRINSESQIVSVLNAISSRTLTPITTYATSSSSATIGPSLLDLSVLIIKSDPTSEDTDKDGYCDVDDPNALSTPVFLNGEYDFLDCEIYSIFDYSNGKNEVCFDVKGASTTTGTQVIMYDFNGNDNQKFRFKWHGNGYTIHPLNNENMSLTVNKSSYEVRLSPNSITPSSTELWEVIPYYLGTEAVVIRSKYVETSSTGKNTALYLSYENDILKLSNDRSSNTKLSLENPSCDWKRFGKIYLDSLDIVPVLLQQQGEAALIYRAMQNYQSNMQIGLSPDNKDTTSVANTTLIINQEGGNFPRLKLANAKMSDVVCGVMATYNAICIANGSNDNIDFFRMAVEFENNALIIMSGRLGSNANKVEECLKVYNMNYKEEKAFFFSDGIQERDNFEKLCSNAKSGIICYRFNLAAMHFFAFHISNKYTCFNRRSNVPQPYPAIDIKDAIGSSSQTSRYFYVGYVLY